MTDREKLLVALLAEPDDEVPTGGISTLEVMALLAELGADYRAMWRDLRLDAGATV